MNLVKISIQSFIIGYLSYYFLSLFMLVGNSGVLYYGEAHLSKWNSWIHTLVMPITSIGLILIVPVIFKFKPENATKIMYSLYFFYGGHYIHINLYITLLFYFIYFFVVYIANNIYKNNNLKKKFIICCVLSIGGLTFQEIVGHWLGGDIASRVEAIPNAILYANYFSLSHFII